MHQYDERMVVIAKRLIYGFLAFSVMISYIQPTTVMANGLSGAENTNIVSIEATPETTIVFDPAKSIITLHEPVSATAQTDTTNTIQHNMLPLALPLPIATVIEQPVALPASPVLITSYRIDNGRLSFVQLFNNSSTMINLQDWSVEYTLVHPVEPTVAMPIQLTAWLPAHQYAVYGQTGLAVQADAEYDMPLTSGYTLGGLRLVPPIATYAPSVVTTGLFIDRVRYDLSMSAAGNYTSTSKFKETATTIALYGGGLYVYPLVAEFKIVEIVAHANDCSPIVRDATCNDYIKIYNPTAQGVILDNYRLRIGYQGQSSSVSNTVQLNGILASGEYLVVNYRNDDQILNISNAGGFVWVEDLHGLKIYEQSVQLYEDASADAHQGQSWALDGTTWKWGIPSPYGHNTFAPPDITPPSVNTLQPCKDNQYRSEETNRCRTIVIATISSPCKDGQYRSEETNRCRNLALAGSTLVACKDDQYRSETTNRCRSLATTVSTLTPCKDNQYRSEETNRCRNIIATGAPTAAFAVEPIAETGKAFVGWYALGGVGALAAGYAGWEWRREAMSAIRRAISFFTQR